MKIVMIIFKDLNYLQYKLRDNISNDLDLHLRQNNNKNYEKSDLNEHFYYLNKIK